MKNINYELLIVIIFIVCFWVLVAEKTFSRDLNVVYRSEIFRRFHVDTTKMKIEEDGFYNDEPSLMEFGIEKDMTYIMLGRAINSFDDEVFMLSYTKRNIINERLNYTLGFGLHKGYKEKYYKEFDNELYEISNNFMITDDIGYEVHFGLGINISDDSFIDFTIIDNCIITTLTTEVF